MTSHLACELTYPESAAVAVIKLEHEAVDVAGGVRSPGERDAVVLGAAVVRQHARSSRYCNNRWRSSAIAAARNEHIACVYRNAKSEPRQLRKHEYVTIYSPLLITNETTAAIKC